MALDNGLFLPRNYVFIRACFATSDFVFFGVSQAT